MNNNKKIFISSLNGDVHVRESNDLDDVYVWFAEGGSVLNDNQNTFIESEGKYVEVSFPTGTYAGLSFQSVNGNIEIDAPNSCFNKILFLAVNGDINGKVKYRQINKEDINGFNNLNSNHKNTSSKHLIKESVNQNTVVKDRTVAKDWKW